MKRDNEPLNAPTAPESISRSAATTTPIPRTTVHPLEKWLLNRLMAAAGNPPIEMSLYGQSVYKPAKSIGRFNICDRAALLKLCTYPDLHFGELYMAGRLEAYGDLTELLYAMNRTLPDCWSSRMHIWTNKEGEVCPVHNVRDDAEEDRFPIATVGNDGAHSTSSEEITKQNGKTGPENGRIDRMVVRNRRYPPLEE